MAIRALLLTLMLLLPGAGRIAVDADSGMVLIAERPDTAERPASLAKMMLAYLAFTALENGAIDADTMVTVSAGAAAQPPVKLGLAAGRKVAFGDLLAAAVVGSANDAAVAVAEALSASEGAFVAAMNDAALSLGMAGTRYATASGLPGRGERLTARDAAILARALLTEYPDRAALFARRSVKAAGRTISTTNPLFGRVTGAAGMKTGFTCAAGYNIVGLIERQDRRVIVVTLGNPDSATRLADVKLLIDDAFDSDGSGTLLPSNPEPGAATDHATCGANAPVVARRSTRPWGTPVNGDTLRPVTPRPASTGAAQGAILPLTAETLDSAPAGYALAGPPPLQGWAAYFGAFASRAQAEEAAPPTPPGWLHAEPRADGRHAALVYDLDRAGARALCAQARRSGRYCTILSPAALTHPRAAWRR